MYSPPTYTYTHRLGMLPSLARLQSECGVFQTTAIRDLNISIERLEKARTDYRAALLWMKDVSDKLHNPDYPNQLTRYREVQRLSGYNTAVYLLEMRVYISTVYTTSVPQLF